MCDNQRLLDEIAKLKVEVSQWQKVVIELTHEKYIALAALDGLNKDEPSPPEPPKEP